MRSVLAIAAVLLSISFASEAAFSAGAPPTVTLNPQPEPPGVVDVTLPPGPCRGTHGKFVKCTIPEGATAKCKDGTFSTRKTRAGTCANHGGVAKWLTTPS